MKIVVLLAKGFEEIEAITLIDLLRRANLEVTTVSIYSYNEIEGGHKIKVISDAVFDEVDFNIFDAIILPGGGEGVLNLAGEEKVLDLVKRMKNNDKYVTSICAAAFVLERAGVIENRNITCYPSWEDKITSAKIVRENVVVDEKIITSRGVGAAIDMGLKLVEIFISKEESEKLRKVIVYKI
jgi:protein deglycase